MVYTVAHLKEDPIASNQGVKEGETLVIRQKRHDGGFTRCRTVRRRSMLGALAALGVAGAFAPQATAGAEATPDAAAARRIDVHHHFFPPAWLQHADRQKPGPSPIMRRTAPRPRSASSITIRPMQRPRRRWRH